jgi:hypothetical protein
MKLYLECRCHNAIERSDNHRKKKQGRFVSYLTHNDNNLSDQGNFQVRISGSGPVKFNFALASDYSGTMQEIKAFGT